MLKELLNTLSRNKYPALLVFLGSLSWVLTMIKSGMPTKWGIGFWGANGHDGIWHLALANSLGRGSLEMPVFSGNLLQNYHIGFDLLFSILSKLTFIPFSIWYFQIIPFVIALSVGILTYKYVLLLSKSQTSALWSTFFVYFGGSFGYLVTFVRGEGIGGESMFWSQQGVSTLINPPFALSLIIILLALILLEKFKKNQSKILFTSVIFLFSLLLSIKAYAGVLVLVALFVQSVFEFIKNKTTVTFLIFVCSTLMSLVLFLPLNKSAGQLIVFQPFWFLETMLSISDRFYWPKLYEAIINWRAAHVYYKAVVGYSLAFAIFIFGNFGTRLISFFLIRNINFSGTTVFLGSLAFAGVLAPTLFLQKGTAWNSIQFFYYTLFIFAIFSGIAVSRLIESIKSNRFRKVFVSTLILLTIPTTISTLVTVYLPGRPPASLPYEELEALNFLKVQPQGTVLTYPFDPLLAKEAVSNPPRPLYLYESTAYVSAFSNQDVFLEDEVNLTIMNYQWKERRKAVDDFYNSTDLVKTHDFLRENNIKYIYWVKPQLTKVGDLQLRIKNIFENKKVIIYEVI